MKTNKIEQIFNLNLKSKWSVYVPSTKNVDEVIDNREEVERVISELAGLFGGATASEAIGGWRTKDGKLVTEKVTIVYAYCTTEDAIAHADEVVGIARRIAREYTQESVTIEYNGQIAFVGAE